MTNNDANPTRRGLYYDLSLSPYGYKTPYGDFFKFRSAKKKEIFVRDLPKHIRKVDKLIEQYDLEGFLPEKVILDIKRSVSQAFYETIEG